MRKRIAFRLLRYSSATAIPYLAFTFARHSRSLRRRCSTSYLGALPDEVLSFDGVFGEVEELIGLVVEVIGVLLRPLKLAKHPLWYQQLNMRVRLLLKRLV